jgi:hypothetical protein
MAAKVMTEATDRSMPPVVMTKVWPTERITRIADEVRIASTLPVERKVELIDWNTTTRTTSPISAAHSA